MIMDFINNPYVAVILFVIFLIVYFVYLDVEGSFSNGFLHFGPGDSRENTKQFMNVNLDSWSKVITLYALCFFTGFMRTYYDNVVTGSILSSISDPSIVEIPYSEAGVYAVTLIDPLIMHSLQVIELLATLTLQFQFILPIVIGSYIGGFPGVYYKLKTKTFIS